jgi:hypothetical protein
MKIVVDRSLRWYVSMIAHPRLMNDWSQGTGRVI